MNDNATVFLAVLLFAIAMLGLLPTLPAHWRNLDSAVEELERGRRELRRARQRAKQSGEHAGEFAPEQPPSRLGRRRARGLPLMARDEHKGPRDVGMLALEVASLLRSGLDMDAAWRTGLERNWGGAPARASQEGRLPGALAAVIEHARRPLPWWRSLKGQARAEHASAATALSSMGVACGASAELGAPLAPVLEAVAQGVARAGDVAHERRVQLASPLATARVLRLLPLAGLLLGGLLGVDPVGVLLGSMPGLVSLAVGGGAMAMGNVWLTRIVRAAEEEAIRVDAAVLVDVCAASMRAGSAVPTVLRAVGIALAEVVGGDVPTQGSGRATGTGARARPLEGGTRWIGGRRRQRALDARRRQLALDGRQTDDSPRESPDVRLARELSQCGQMLLLGASWEVAWERVEPMLLPLNQALQAAWEDGAAPEGMLEHAAASLRARQMQRARVAAAELGTRLIGPVSLCMLPAFVALGIVPVVLGGAIGLLSG